jgi:hypothetical protein
MKLKKIATSVAVTALLGLGVAVADPAAAATGSWTAYGTTNPITSTQGSQFWDCGATREFDTNALAQACAVRSRSDNSKVRMAVIVKNNRSGLYGAEVAAILRNDDNRNLGRWECGRSNIGARSWSVCYGSWVSSPYPSWVRTTSPGVNGQSIPSSSGV